MEEKQKERQMTGFDFRKEAEGLLDFIDKSPTVFHTVANAAAMLDAAGFCRLAESGHWELSAGKKCDKKRFLSDCLYDSGRRDRTVPAVLQPQ